VKLSTVFLFLNCVFYFIGCNSDSAINTITIKGVWFEDVYVEDFNRISRLEYNFKEKGIVEILRIEMDKDSVEILGYRYRTTGNYKQAEEKLFFYNLVSYSNDDSKGDYSKLHDLMKASAENSYAYSYEISSDGRELTFFYPPCSPSANCVTEQTFTKVM